MPICKKILSGAAYIGLVFLLALVGLEFLARGMEKAFQAGVFQAKSDFAVKVATHEIPHKLHNRFWRAFLGSPRSDERILPHILEYANDPKMDQEKIQKIASENLYPPNRSWRARDLVREREPNGGPFFRVTSNNLGFRGTHPVSWKKAAGTYRILVLGSYQAFGHGVDDENTYASKLETGLVKFFRARNLTVEVLNASMQSALAVKGLAFLRARGEELSPDLVILDYGFPDILTSGWNPIIEPHGFLFGRDHPLYSFFQGLNNSFLTKVAGHFYVTTHASLAFSQKFRSRNISEWRAVSAEILQWLGRRKIPVILLDQPLSMPKEEYLSLAASNPCAAFFSINDYIFSHQAARPDRAWLEEFSPGLRKFLLPYPHVAWLKSAAHVAEEAHEKIAAEIRRRVEGSYLEYSAYRKRGAACTSELAAR